MNYDFSLIHKFCLDGVYIVLDIYSGLVHEVSPLVWEFLEEWEKTSCQPDAVIDGLAERYDRQELEQAWRDLAELIGQGMLFSRSSDVDNFQPQKESYIKALCLHAAHDCNMRCRYCFAGTGAFGGKRSLMDLETGKQALEFLFEASGPKRHVEIDYFGGEPLMNFAVVKELIGYGKKRAEELGKVIKQTLTTNGLLLSQDVIDFLNHENISLVLSLDGRPEVNDVMRPLANGQGSYSYILPRFKALVESRGGQNYYVRGTYTNHNRDFCSDVLHLVNQGFDLVSVEPVVAGPESEYALKDEDVPELEAQYEELTRAWLKTYKNGKPFNFFHFNIDLDKGPCLPKRLSGCGAGHEYLAVSPEGDLYPCHQFVGMDEFKLGTVWSGIYHKDWGDKFKTAHVQNKETCRNCWARYHCSGGCHANAWQFNGSLLIPYELGCKLEKKRLECAIYLQVVQSRTNLD